MGRSFFLLVDTHLIEPLIPLKKKDKKAQL